jgi:predicted DNA-binding protein
MSRMNEKLAVRIPASMKRKVRAEARQRLLEEADIVREALSNHLAKSSKKEGVAA